MIVQVEIRGRAGSPETVIREVGFGYGVTPAVALEVLALALVHAEWPLLLDVNGELLEFEPGSVHRVWVLDPSSV